MSSSSVMVRLRPSTLISIELMLPASRERERPLQTGRIVRDTAPSAPGLRRVIALGVFRAVVGGRTPSPAARDAMRRWPCAAWHAGAGICRPAPGRQSQPYCCQCGQELCRRPGPGIWARLFPGFLARPARDSPWVLTAAMTPRLKPCRRGLLPSEKGDRPERIVESAAS